MRTKSWLPVWLVLALAAPAVAQPPSSATLTDRVRDAILRLPYYGVFDMIAFRMDGRDVTLGGAVTNGSLKQSAKEEIREIPGIGRVTDRIEVLPASTSDDALRHTVFHALYTDDFLSHYGTPAGRAFAGRSVWGRGYSAWPGFRTGTWTRAPYWGMEPLGNYAIHIIVNRGRVALFGDVRTETERTRAEQVARGIPGVFAVENHIQAEEGRPDREVH